MPPKVQPNPAPFNLTPREVEIAVIAWKALEGDIKVSKPGANAIPGHCRSDIMSYYASALPTFHLALPCTVPPCLFFCRH